MRIEQYDIIISIFNRSSKFIFIHIHIARISEYTRDLNGVFAFSTFTNNADMVEVSKHFIVIELYVKLYNIKVNRISNNKQVRNREPDVIWTKNEIIISI